MEYTIRRDLAAHRLNTEQTEELALITYLGPRSLAPNVSSRDAATGLRRSILGEQRLCMSCVATAREGDRFRRRHRVGKTMCRVRYGGDVQPAVQSHRSDGPWQSKRRV